MGRKKSGVSLNATEPGGLEQSTRLREFSIFRRAREGVWTGEAHQPAANVLSLIVMSHMTAVRLRGSGARPGSCP